MPIYLSVSYMSLWTPEGKELFYLGLDVQYSMYRGSE